MQSAVLRSHVVCPSVTLVDHDRIGGKSWKIIARTISPTSLLLVVAQRSSTYSQGNMEKFWGENVSSTPTSITSDGIESTESHVILGGGVAVCLLLSTHRAVIFAIIQLPCFNVINYGLRRAHGCYYRRNDVTIMTKEFTCCLSCVRRVLRRAARCIRRGAAPHGTATGVNEPLVRCELAR